MMTEDRTPGLVTKSEYLNTKAQFCVSFHFGNYNTGQKDQFSLLIHLSEGYTVTPVFYSELFMNKDFWAS